MREHHREIFDQQHALHQGKIIQYFGDGTVSIFISAVQAVTCDFAIHRLLSEDDSVVPLRIGLHMGDIVHSDTEVYGDGVNVAARIESMGIAGALLVSERINDELKNQQHISTRSLGKFELKNIAQPVEVFAIKNEGLKVSTAEDFPQKPGIPTKSIAVLPNVTGD